MWDLILSVPDHCFIFLLCNETEKANFHFSNNKSIVIKVYMQQQEKKYFIEANARNISAKFQHSHNIVSEKLIFVYFSLHSFSCHDIQSN